MELFGPRAEKSQNFKEVLDAKLKELNIDCKVVLQDERLSTVSSQKVLIESGVRREKRKNFVDKIAATIILQSFLDTKF